MAKSYNQKGKILYLERILQGTGENHTVSMQEILDELTEQGISAERKSIYDDMEVLRLFGMDIRYKRGKSGGYYLAGKANGQASANEQGTVDGQCAVKEQREAEPVWVLERKRRVLKFSAGLALRFSIKKKSSVILLQWYRLQRIRSFTDG